MGAIGGSIQSLSIDGRTFPVAADAEANVKLGGYENEKQANGDGKTTRTIKTISPWSIDGVAVEIDDDRADLEYLQGIADSSDDVPIAITYASGVVYQGDGTITGEIQKSTQNATAPLSLMGSGKLSQQ